MFPLPEQVSHLIRHRRSVYPPQYSGQVVDRYVIEAMLENANWAPTHARTEPWRFTVYTGDGLKQLAEFQSELYRELSSQGGNFDEKKYYKLSQKPLQCSHVIAIGMRRDPKQRVPELEEVAATACAVQNMQLTAAAYGIGCYWGSGGITYWEEAKPFFGLAPDDKLLGFLYVGVPKADPRAEGQRGDIDEKVTWVE